MISKRRWTAGFVYLVLGVIGVLAFSSVFCSYPIMFNNPNAYGEVPIPGSASLHLPPGEVDVTLRSVGPAAELSVPPLSIRISGPDGTPQPEVIESRRTINITEDDTRVRVWVVQVVQEADYHIEIEGEVHRPDKPWLAFGHTVWNGWLWLLFILGFAAGFPCAVVGPFILVGTLMKLWARRRPQATSPAGSPPPEPTSCVATSDGMRLEQHKTIARLRSSGALTEKEFKAERRRILRG